MAIELKKGVTFVWGGSSFDLNAVVCVHPKIRIHRTFSNQKECPCILSAPGNLAIENCVPLSFFTTKVHLCLSAKHENGHFVKRLVAPFDPLLPSSTKSRTAVITCACTHATSNKKRHLKTNSHFSEPRLIYVTST